VATYRHAYPDASVRQAIFHQFKAAATDPVLFSRLSIVVRGEDEDELEVVVVVYDELANYVDGERSDEFEQCFPSSKDPSSFDISSSTGSRRHYCDIVMPRAQRA